LPSALADGDLIHLVDGHQRGRALAV